MDWARILAYVTGTVDQELLARNEYLAAENRILKAQLKGRMKLSDAERPARSVIDWAARFSARWPRSPGRTPSLTSQDVADRLIADLVPQIGQRPHNPVIAPVTGSPSPCE